MDKTHLFLKCPKCGLPASAVLDDSYYKFLVYTCPRCKSNVVYYDNKMDTISDFLLRKVLKKHKLKFCGGVTFASAKKSPDKPALRDDGCITKDKIMDLRILLETEKDFNSFLSKL